MVNKAQVEMGDLCAQMYEDDIKGGLPSIAPEKLLRAMLLQLLHPISSERLLLEHTQFTGPFLCQWAKR